MNKTLSPSEYLLDRLLEQSDTINVRDIDVSFARFIQELDTNCDALETTAYLLSQTLGKGNVCLDFSQPHEIVDVKGLRQLQKKIASSCVVRVLNQDELMQANINVPLVLHGDRLYLQRYWLYEMNLHQAINNNMHNMPWQLDSQVALIHQLFPDVSAKQKDKKQEIDWQAVAACIAANKKFSVISGGPGTGKTTTVIRLLALLIHQYQAHYQRAPIIKLAAPTGKAAMRLTESIIGAKQHLAVNEDIKKHIPDQASTLHRLLGRARNGEFKYNQFNPLHLDVLIVDEASMVDMPLMSKLMAALPPHGQIILLGDKDQLASVEAGSVLADICDSEAQHGYSDANLALLKTLSGQSLDENETEPCGAVIRDHICQLRKSYRFHAQSGIGQLALAANNGDFRGWKTVQKSGYEDLNLLPLSDEVFDDFIAQAAKHYTDYIQLIDPAGTSDEQAMKIYEAFNQFQVLCALRDGPLGVAGLNEAIENALVQSRVINNTSQWYLGRPVMVMENDYGLNLYNGDIGIILPLLDRGVDVQGVVRPKVAFIASDGGVRWIQPSRLPKHETVYTMTVHKSQGSEFAHCALVLPDYHASVITKELIYTGITRAKKRLTLLARESVIKSGLKTRVQRFSGLKDRLWLTKERLTGERLTKEQPIDAAKSTEKGTEKEPSVNTESQQISLF